MKWLFKKIGVHNINDGFELFRQFFKFGIVGISNTLISLAIYYILICFSVYYIIANVGGFFISLLNAWYWNHKYVFRLDKKQQKMHSFTKMVSVYGFTFLLGTALLYLMVQVFGVSQYVAPILNLLITIPINFLLNKFWAFK